MFAKIMLFINIKIGINILKDIILYFPRFIFTLSVS